MDIACPFLWSALQKSYLWYIILTTVHTCTQVSFQRAATVCLGNLGWRWAYTCYPGCFGGCLCYASDVWLRAAAEKYKVFIRNLTVILQGGFNFTIIRKLNRKVSGAGEWRQQLFTSVVAIVLLYDRGRCGHLTLEKTQTHGCIWQTFLRLGTWTSVDKCAHHSGALAGVSDQLTTMLTGNLCFLTSVVVLATADVTARKLFCMLPSPLPVSKLFLWSRELHALSRFCSVFDEKCHIIELSLERCLGSLR